MEDPFNPTLFKEPHSEKKLSYNWDVFAKTPGLELFGPDSKVEALDGGTINYVHRMRSDKDPSRTVIVKHGDDHVKLFPWCQMAPERTVVEFWAMKKMDEMIPGSVPTPFLMNPADNYIVMEDLGSYEILRNKLNKGDLDLSVLETLTRDISRLHQATHKATLGSAEHQKLIDMCKPTYMREVGIRLVFVDPFERKGEGKYIEEVENFQKDDKLWGSFSKLRDLEAVSSDCLVHGDFHTSSVMVKGSDIKIFDFEFVHMGPAGNDFGHMLANLIKPYLDHKLFPLSDKSEFCEQLGQAIRKSVETYFKEAREYLPDDDYVKTISETAGYTGVRLIRRVWGVQELGEEPNKPEIDKALMSLGYRLLTDYENIRTIEALNDYILTDN